MAWKRRYDHRVIEPALADRWEEEGVYRFSSDSGAPVYAIDTPPATVSGYLHIGHMYSYSHADFAARFHRMIGQNVFYPMGYDDNGLPTDRLVEKRLGRTAAEVGKDAYAQECLRVSHELEDGYEVLWRRLGLSVDWRYTYRTVDSLAQRTSQSAFIDLVRKGIAYRRSAPTLWCPECHTAIAQAEVNDLERPTELVSLAFQRANGKPVAIATTRPELLPACVAVFVHPEDDRYGDLVGEELTVPLSGVSVPVLADSAADPRKGTGAVMCCTFGDAADVEWWYRYDLPLRETIDRNGRMTAPAGELAGLTVHEARRRTREALEASDLILAHQPITHSVRVHERCDTPVEYTVSRQWFIRVLDRKEELIAAGEDLRWYPAGMKTRYREWVANLHWDWSISRQRSFGVPFPVWYCHRCDEVILADEAQLPVDPARDAPPRRCSCGSVSFYPEEDVMDTWATSSLTPQIAGRRLADPDLYARVFPMSLRPQAHDIIRTWAFYTVVRSCYQFGGLPWRDVLVSGHGVAAAGKISKSRGEGPLLPAEMFERYSADAVRYWAASTGPGKDAIVNEEKIAAGAKLVTKLWNVAGFSQRFLDGYTPPRRAPSLSPADRWILSRTQGVVAAATASFHDYDYASARNATEAFLWHDLADNYLEMAKKRLYDAVREGHDGARFALHHALLTLLKLLAPILPYVTDEIYRTMFASDQALPSIHRCTWPVTDDALVDAQAEIVGEALVTIATAVRRYKSDRGLSLSRELSRIQLATAGTELADSLLRAADDLTSIARVRRIEVCDRLDRELDEVQAGGSVAVAVEP